MESENKNSQSVAHINLFQGKDFMDCRDYSALGSIVKRTIEEQGLDPANIIITGYDAAVDSEESDDSRHETFALTLEEFDEGARGRGTNALQYAGIGKKWSEKPVIGVYDRSSLTEHPGENRYTTPYRTPLGEHKIMEIFFHATNK